MTPVGKTPDRDPRSPVEVVKRRYVKGEIDEDEFEDEIEDALTGEYPHNVSSKDIYPIFVGEKI